MVSCDSFIVSTARVKCPPCVVGHNENVDEQSHVLTCWEQ